MPDPVDVLIVGAGPAGSATALRLARKGYSVQLLDRATFPRDKACSEYLSPAAVHQLQQLELPEDPGSHRGAPIDGTTVQSARGPCLTGRFGPVDARPGRAIKRTVLDSMILDAALSAGARYEQARMSDLITDASGVRGVSGTTPDGRATSWSARVVIGADGLRSRVAHCAGVRRQGRLRRIAFSAHMRHVADVTCTTEMHVGAGGYVGINFLGNNLSNVTLVVDAKSGADARGDATKYFLAALQRIPALAHRIASAEIAREVLVTGPFDAQVRRSVGDGFLLVGDAADFFDPFTGDGIYSALVGAQLAADTIAEALAMPGPVTARRLAQYRTRRREAFLGKWILERTIGYAMLAPRCFDRAVTRLDRRGMADMLIGATGHVVSPWRVLNPVFFARAFL